MSSRLRGVRVLVVGIYYSPDSTGIAPYTTDLCQILASEGASVDAVVGIPHYPKWQVEPGYRWPLTRLEIGRGVRVHRVRHYVPKRQDPLRRGLYEASFWVLARAVLRNIDADVVVAVTPNIGAVPAALSASQRSRAHLGVIVQDLLGQAAVQSGTRGGLRVAEIVRRLEGRWLSKADRVAVIAEAFKEPLARQGVNRSRIQVMPNYTQISPSDLSSVRAKGLMSWPTDQLIVTHTGNMGYKQDLSNVVAAARLANSSETNIRFVLIGDGAMRGTLESAAAGLNKIEFVDPLDDATYPVALAASDILLVNERETVRDMSLPSKVTSYLAAGRPIVAAVHREGATSELIAQSGAGVIVRPNSPESLLAELERLGSSPEERRALGARGPFFVKSHLSRDAAAGRIVDFVLSLKR